MLNPLVVLKKPIEFIKNGLLIAFAIFVIVLLSIVWKDFFNEAEIDEDY